MKNLEKVRIISETSKQLISRLERLSADSHWAHRASGIRGALIRTRILFLENPHNEMSILISLMEQAYIFLEKAAREIPDYDADRFD
ncbi:MAG: hypothetical protein JEZ06_04530 [Anaerolineaceae bacterium]|nr:hypothetical protein [Anaerolineaceae bacterium]